MNNKKDLTIYFFTLIIASHLLDWICCPCEVRVLGNEAGGGGGLGPAAREGRDGGGTRAHRDQVDVPAEYVDTAFGNRRLSGPPNIQ